MRRSLDDLMTFGLIAAAATMAGMAIRHYAAGPRVVSTTRSVEHWRMLAHDGHRRGPAAAPVTIVEFADFQCPSCERVRFSIDTVLTRHSADVALVYRHYPLRMTHPYSDAAANAAECAADQGRFFELATAMFDSQSRLGYVSWSSLGARSGVRDTARFNRCVTGKWHAANVERDAAVGDSIGLFGTPTLIINGKLLVGALSTSELEHEVDAARQRGTDWRER